MAKKNFKGGLDSLIENSLGIKKSRKGEMKGNPVDLIRPEQTDDNDEVLAKPRTPKKSTEVKGTEDAEIKSTEVTEAKGTDNTEVKGTEATEAKSTEVTEIKGTEVTEINVPEDMPESVTEDTPDPETETEIKDPQTADDDKKEISVSLDAADDDSTTIAYLKEVISDLRHELFLWRNGTINVQTFNATLHTHGLKYNPDNNEIEEFDAI